MVWVITGVSRGIGKAMAVELLEEGETVYGVSRKIYDSVVALEKKYSSFRPLIGDLRNEEDIRKIAESVEEKVDFLVNNAGVLVRESYPEFSQESFLETMKVNVFAPLKLTAEIDRRGLLKNGSKVVNTSSIMGSISLASSTSSYSYSISKAALNMVTKLLSAQLSSKGVIVISVHPGWVRTDMGGSAAPVLPEESAKGIISVAKKITMKDTGKFFEYTGRELPW
jgi:NAD(P)-dependent dehydrogenase (short-subunit alcohol dehydrogenase family)